MDGEPDPTSSGPGPGGDIPDDPNAAWRRPGNTPVGGDSSAAATTGPTVAVDPAPRGVFGRLSETVRSWWKDLEFIQMWHVVAIAAVLTTAGFGGLDKVEKAPETFNVGQAFDNHEFSITVQRASLVKKLAGNGFTLKEKPGRSYLGVLVDVTNHGEGPDGVSSIFALPDVADAQNTYLPSSHDPTALRMSDGTMLTALQPGLTEKVALVWSVPDTAVAVGSTVTVEVPYRKYGQGYVIYGAGWQSVGGSARTVVPVGSPK
ncbi:DUF4352 domain-containing protein [Mycobacterium sp. D16R24]|uniref:DUF4352 domain-containing protein n=1 Tax=Mycobacterium sp. D16R24 TaxID=1855656 RepID=UPI000992F1A4|nr:DUF4352 domain-containing protein [Mycobacterium sp. D16R24]